MTPFTLGQLDEVVNNLSDENKHELALLGHTDIEQAIIEMYETSECYLVRAEGESFIAVGGLFYYDDQQYPQMFCMFSDKIKENFTLLARGSRMLVNFFDQTQEGMTMTILAEYESMLQWAAWLGFEPVGISQSTKNKYVEFVRCNPNKKNVYDSPLRPIMH